jgi:hypothetical protein
MFILVTFEQVCRIGTFKPRYVTISGVGNSCYAGNGLIDRSSGRWPTGLPTKQTRPKKLARLIQRRNLKAIAMFRGSLMQSHQYQQGTTDDYSRDRLARERCSMLPDLRLHKQGVVKLGHGYFLPATLMTQRPSRIFVSHGANIAVWGGRSLFVRGYSEIRP